MLVSQGRLSRYTLVPMVFVTTMAFLAAVYQLWDLFRTGRYFLMALDLMILAAAVLVLLEAGSTLVRASGR